MEEVKEILQRLRRGRIPVNQANAEISEVFTRTVDSYKLGALGDRIKETFKE